MKKTIGIVVFAFILGGCLSMLTVYNLKDKLSFLSQEENKVTAFQVGVFKSEENASASVQKYPGSIMIKDGEYYRVYVGVAASKDWESTLESYYLSKNVSVYPKEIKVTSSFYQELNKYEKLLPKTDSSIFEQLNSEILKKLEGEVL